MLARPERDLASAHALVGDNRPWPRGTEWRDGAAFVSRRLPGYIGIGHGQAGYAQQPPQLRPGNSPFPGAQHEQEVIVAAAHDQRLNHIGWLDAAGSGSLSKAAY